MAGEHFARGHGAGGMEGAPEKDRGCSGSAAPRARGASGAAF